MNQLSEFAANYDYAVGDGVAAGVFGIFFVVYFLIIFLSMALSMVSYVLHSLGLYTIAERRKIMRSIRGEGARIITLTAANAAVLVYLPMRDFETGDA